MSHHTPILPLNGALRIPREHRGLARLVKHFRPGMVSQDTQERDVSYVYWIYMCVCVGPYSDDPPKIPLL